MLLIPPASSPVEPESPVQGAANRKHATANPSQAARTLCTASSRHLPAILPPSCRRFIRNRFRSQILLSIPERCCATHVKLQ